MYISTVTFVSLFYLCFVLCYFTKSETDTPKNANSSVSAVSEKNQSEVEEKSKMNFANVSSERITQPIGFNLTEEIEGRNKFAGFKPSPMLKSDLSFEKESNLDVRSHNRIIFPQKTTNNHPYPFVNSNDQHYGTNNIGFNPPKVQYQNEDFRNFHTFTPIKKYAEFNDFELQEKPHELETRFPWKKIVHLLTTFVPLGILLSALIPNVITINPVTTTAQSRARVDESEPKTNPKMQLIYSTKLNEELGRKGCDQRMLCEVLLGSGNSRNPKETASRLMKIYIQKEGKIDEKAEELKRIMMSVKKGSCDYFKCKAFT